MSEARAIFDKPISDLTFEPLCSGFFFLQLHPEPRHICKKSLKASSIEPPRLLTKHDIHLYSVHIQHICTTSIHILQLQSGDLVERQDQNVINHMLTYFYAALGDFENASLGDINSTPFTKSVQVAYVLLNNLLMVNLIIAMMGNCSSLSPPRPLLPRPRPPLSPSAPYFYCLCVVNVTNCA